MLGVSEKMQTNPPFRSFSIPMALTDHDQCLILQLFLMLHSAVQIIKKALKLDEGRREDLPVEVYVGLENVFHTQVFVAA